MNELNDLCMNEWMNEWKLETKSKNIQQKPMLR